MANTMYFKDGSIEYFFNEPGTPEFYNDFQKIIAEKLGSDAEQVVADLRTADDYEQKKFNSDMVAYESQLEENTACFQEILEAVETLNNLLSQKRLNRTELFKVVASIKNTINNQI